MTIAQFYSHYLERLVSIYDKREAENISKWVLENITGMRKWEIRRSDIEPGENVTLQLRNHLEELLQHKPVQYVLHESWFYRMKFFVNEHVLIPRPETEELVSLVVNDKNDKGFVAGVSQERIIDIGTGSGCIAISLKKELPGNSITAIDISEQALSVAKKNANDLNATIEFLKINFLDEEARESLSTYDVIVSNPPYIPEKQSTTMGENITAFEPSIALFVPDDEPLIFYKAICKFARVHLNNKGRVYMEVHENLAGKVSDIFADDNFRSEIIKDIYGKERIVRAMK